jgi:hypothetical protein
VSVLVGFDLGFLMEVLIAGAAEIFYFGGGQLHPSMANAVKMKDTIPPTTPRVRIRTLFMPAFDSAVT